MNPETWWYAARATGLVAFGLLGVSVVVGILLAGRPAGRRPPADWVLDWHRFLGGLSTAFVGAHVATIWIDDYIDFGVTDLTVPFVSGWRPFAMAFGIVAFYLVLAVEVTSLLRRRLPLAVWRRVHFLSYAAFVLAVIHLFTAGEDAGNAIVVAATSALIGATAVLLCLRLLSSAPTEPVSGGRAPSSPDPAGVGGSGGRAMNQPLRESPEGELNP